VLFRSRADRHGSLLRRELPRGGGGHGGQIAGLRPARPPEATRSPPGLGRADPSSRALQTARSSKGNERVEAVGPAAAAGAPARAGGSPADMIEKTVKAQERASREAPTGGEKAQERIRAPCGREGRGRPGSFEKKQASQEEIGWPVKKKRSEEHPPRGTTPAGREVPSGHRISKIMSKATNVRSALAWIDRARERMAAVESDLLRGDAPRARRRWEGVFKATYRAYTRIVRAALADARR
jgi:hypothetical protein